MSIGSYQQFCPVAMAAEILCTRWTIILLREMFAGSTRFNELRRGVPRMSPALLSQRLKELEMAGIISHAASASDPGVFEYQLTESGRELGPLVEAFGVWGQRRIESTDGIDRKPSTRGFHANLAGPQSFCQGTEARELGNEKRVYRAMSRLQHLNDAVQFVNWTRMAIPR